jgi:hypothetical protein
MSDFNEQLCKGDWVRLASIEPSATVRVDWINAREAAPGYIAIVEEVYESSVQLLCEPKPGFLEWRTLFTLEGLSYDVVSAPNATATATATATA